MAIFGYETGGSVAVCIDNGGLCIISLLLKDKLGERTRLYVLNLSYLGKYLESTLV